MSGLLASVRRRAADLIEDFSGSEYSDSVDLKFTICAQGQEFRATCFHHEVAAELLARFKQFCREHEGLQRSDCLQFRLPTGEAVFPGTPLAVLAPGQKLILVSRKCGRKGGASCACSVHAVCGMCQPLTPDAIRAVQFDTCVEVCEIPACCTTRSYESFA